MVKAMMVLKGMLNLSSVMNRREHFRDVGPHGAYRERGDKSVSFHHFI